MTAPTTERQVTITLDFHKAWLITANHRLHWRVKAERSRTIRTLAWSATRQANLGTLQGRQHCIVTVRWPTGHRRDVANWHPLVKPAIDGMVDAGLLIDDSTRYLLGPDLRPSEERCDPRYACSLTFAFAPDGEAA